MSWTQDKPAATQREIITFLVGGQEFGIDVMSVREIRVWGPATPIALAPPYIVGMINLRGAVLPILDFAARLGFGATQPTNRHAILVAQFGKDDVGLLVEGVSEIMTISTADIQPVPNMASMLAAQFLSGVVPCEKRMISLIALESLAPRSGDAMAA